MVRPRDMQLIAQVSGGWINLTPPPAEPDAVTPESDGGAAAAATVEPDPAEAEPGS